jgi:hypothetical protein
LPIPASVRRRPLASAKRWDQGHREDADRQQQPAGASSTVRVPATCAALLIVATSPGERDEDREAERAADLQRARQQPEASPASSGATSSTTAAWLALKVHGDRPPEGALPDSDELEALLCSATTLDAPIAHAQSRSP